MNRCLISIATAALTAMPLMVVAAPAVAPFPSGGTIAIVPRTGDGEYDRSMPVFVDAVGKSLTARGFTILDDPDHAAAVLDLTLSRTDVGTGLGKDPHPEHVMVGPGVIVPMSTGNSHLAALTRSSLELRIHRRGEGAGWDGTAVTVRQADTRTGSDTAVAAALTDALLQRYPVVPKDVIGVP